MSSIKHYQRLPSPIIVEKLHNIWAKEALQRRDEVRKGLVKTISGEHALLQVRLAIAERFEKIESLTTPVPKLEPRNKQTQ